MSLKNSYKIVNIVASTIVGTFLDLPNMYEGLENTEYDPEFYHALKYKTQNPKATVLVIKSGKIIICGVKAFDEIIRVRDLLYSDLRKIGYTPMINQVKIENVVFCSEINQNINLIKLSKRIGGNYEPKYYPGLIYKNYNPKFTAIIFKSGKFNVTGLNNFNDIPKVINTIKKLLNS